MIIVDGGNHGNERFTLLLVEDNPADIGLIREIILESQHAFDLHVARDGVQAMEFLKRQAGYEHAPHPDLILLDLNMPRKDGREVLQEVKSDADLRRIPVVVLTTSDGDRDVRTAYDLHANSYMVKPIDLDEYARIIHGLADYWFLLSRLPRG